jgi:hypothetical protein
MIVRNREGFALPMVVLAVGLVTAGVMAAFTRSTVEARIADNQQEQQAAFAVANAGLERYIAEGMVIPSDTTVGRTLNFPDGSALVRLRVMRHRTSPLDSALYVIWSVGTLNRGNTGIGRPPATRTVAQLAVRPTGSMQVHSAWTSLSGLRKDGEAGGITGYDACTGEALPGVAVPDKMYTGKDGPVSGDPPILYMGSQEEMASKLNLNWSGITDPASPAISPTHVICLPGTHAYDAEWGPCSSWPSEADFQQGWPVVVINGSKKGLGDAVNALQYGRGTLIVTGDFDLNGGDTWDGIVLVGGAMHDNGTGAVQGAVITGLNVLKGMTVNESSRAHGTKTYTYNSCNVAEAAGALARLAPLSNTWVDNWSAW